MSISCSRIEICKVSLENIATQSKAASLPAKNNNKTISERPISQSKEFSTDLKWDNLNTK